MRGWRLTWPMGQEPRAVFELEADECEAISELLAPDDGWREELLEAAAELRRNKEF